MTSIRIGVLAVLVLTLSACVTSIRLNSPARAAAIVAAENGPEEVYWTYENSLRRGGDRASWRAHLEQYEDPRPLPVYLQASDGQSLWIVPICNGKTLWDRARSYQFGGGDMTVRVQC